MAQARERVADERDRVADDREHLADERQRVANLRDDAADRRANEVDKADHGADVRRSTIGSTSSPLIEALRVADCRRSVLIESQARRALAPLKIDSGRPTGGSLSPTTARNRPTLVSSLPMSANRLRIAATSTSRRWSAQAAPTAQRRTLTQRQSPTRTRVADRQSRRGRRQRWPAKLPMATVRPSAASIRWLPSS